MTTKTTSRKVAPKTIAAATGNIDLPQVAIDLIDFSPLNYRKTFSQEALEAFAATLKQQGIISPLTVRPLPNGRYELVVGERRLRAAKMAGLTHVPAIIKDMTDAEVIEMQLSENLQRENTHPMEEAFAIERMQQTGKSIQAIAARLGKSKLFVFSRLKLLSLIESIRAMFIGNAINLTEAFQIAALSEDSQTAFYEDKCNNWQEEEDFKLRNLEYILRAYQYNLQRAPFDTKRKDLLPEVGACTKCSSNSASLKSLFPEYAKDAVCSDRSCYQNKCTAHIGLQVAACLAEQQPEGLLLAGIVPTALDRLFEKLPALGALTQCNAYEVSVCEAPELPDAADYTDEDDEPDEAAYGEAMDEYYQELAEFEQMVSDGKLHKGLKLSESSATLVLYSDEPMERATTSNVTAKDAQAAIKDGTATPELLHAEITRQQTRETRFKELDRGKVQTAVHAQFAEAVETNADCMISDQDKITARYIVYQAMGWSARRKANDVLFAHEEQNNLSLYEKLASLTEDQFAYLIRLCIISMSGSKTVDYEPADFLYQTAKGAGIDIDAIELVQAEKATARADKMQARVAELELKIKRMEDKERLRDML